MNKDICITFEVLHINIVTNHIVVYSRGSLEH